MSNYIESRLGKNGHDAFCTCPVCCSPEILEYERRMEDELNRDLRITKAIERAAITIAAAIISHGAQSFQNATEAAKNLWKESGE